MGYRQLIIARKDLKISPGKLSAQVSHASMAFLTTWIRKRANSCLNDDGSCSIRLTEKEKQIYDNWICGLFTKTVCEAKNRNQLMKAVTIAESLGMKENEDYFLIKDACLTELEFSGGKPQVLQPWDESPPLVFVIGLCHNIYYEE